MALREQLAYLSNGVRGLGSDEILPEWHDALHRLGGLIRKVAEPFIKDNLLVVSEGRASIAEEGVGQYVVPNWSLISGPRKINIDPIARIIAGSSGKVSIRSKYALVEYELFRVGLREQEQWYVIPRNTFLPRLNPLFPGLDNIPPEEQIKLDEGSLLAILERMFE